MPFKCPDCNKFCALAIVDSPDVDLDEPTVTDNGNGTLTVTISGIVTASAESECCASEVALYSFEFAETKEDVPHSLDYPFDLDTAKLEDESITTQECMEQAYGKGKPVKHVEMSGTLYVEVKDTRIVDFELRYAEPFSLLEEV